MDFGFSPDLDAVWCYAILAVIAAFSAKRQLAKLLDPLVRESLSTFQGWMLYGAYLVIPVLLFWFLDRTGAIHDTSLFAAVVVGVAYDRILSGEINSLSIPGAGGMWKPFTAWADRVTSSIKKRLFQYDQRFNDRVISGVVHDPAKMTSLEALLRSRLSNPAQLTTDLAAIDSLVTGPAAQTPEWVLHKRARCLYGYIMSLPDWQFLLMEQSVTSKFSYYWYVEQWKSKTISIVMALALAGAVTTVVTQISDTPWAVRYDAWRLVKSNSSEHDRARARTRLIDRLKSGQSQTLVVERLVKDIRTPGLPAERVDLLLGMLLEARQSLGTSDDVAFSLIDALRVVGVDSRTRILQTLRFMAKQDRVKLDDALATKWQPTEGDSVNDLEQYIVELTKAWKSSPAPGKNDSERVTAPSDSGKP